MVLAYNVVHGSSRLFVDGIIQNRHGGSVVEFGRGRRGDPSENLCDA